MFENEGTPETTQEVAPETSGDGSDGAIGQASEGGEGAPSVVELDSLEKFRFAGREWTPKDFQGAYMMQSDYTRKTQQLAEERKYYDNLAADLETVKKDPRLIEKFKTTYPKKFHGYLGFVQSPQAAQSAAGQMEQSGQGAQAAKPQMDPELQERLNRMESYYKTQTQQAADAQVEANCQKFGTKYPSVQGLYESLALGILQSRLDSMKQSDPDAKLTEKDWEAAYKQVHESNLKSAKDLYSKQVKQQKDINQKAKDVAAGGGIPGQAPKNPRSIREASALVRQELENS